MSEVTLKSLLSGLPCSVLLCYCDSLVKNDSQSVEEFFATLSITKETFSLPVSASSFYAILKPASPALNQIMSGLAFDQAINKDSDCFCADCGCCVDMDALWNSGLSFTSAGFFARDLATYLQAELYYKHLFAFHSHKKWRAAGKPRTVCSV